MSAFDEFDTCRCILESLLTGVCVVDMHKKIVFWSDGAERITGHLRHEVIGRSCTSGLFLHCQPPGCEFCIEECPLARAIKTAHPVDIEGFVHHKSGYEAPVRIRAGAVHNQHGSIIGAVETFDELEQSDVNHIQQKFPDCVDDNTGAASKGQIESHLRDALTAFAERQVVFGLLRVRLQGLERFRNAFGSDAALSLLRVVAHSLTSTLWRTDVVGRWTDDQFLVILNGCREESLPQVRERLQVMLANDFIEWWGERRSLPISVGEASAQAGETIESILDRTQKSLHRSSELLHGADAAGKDQASGS